MPRDGSRIEPRLDLDDPGRKIAGATLRVGRRPAPAADTIGFARAPLSLDGPGRHPSMVPAVLMLAALGAALAAIGLYLS